ncbi:MAG: tyrosine-type recombinase/integrase [Caldilinea sp.]|nr:tyrosine-type recombinase/integrase [Caldilineaceae bacterium]MCB9119365.1 tyrosine-type recombinase/integrase [Caldilineaceae bacterium]MCO5209357.1 tyrosine-type recombinase/integrase [Caldilinea sp.]HRX02708.1 tyrosine-type recombinase/integrase [Anaerolineae bacterium]
MSRLGIRSVELNEAYEIFYLDCQSRRLTASTLRFYRVTLNLVFKWLRSEGVDRLDQVTAHHVRKFLHQRQEAGLSTYTQHKYARALRAFFNFCVREELLAKSPMATVTMPRVEKLIPTSFTHDEAQEIIKACDTERDRAMILVMLDTGVRSAELLSLDVGDVDAKAGEILVRHGKGQKQRTVFIGLKARKQVMKYLAQRDEYRAKSPLWVSETTGERLTRSGLVHLMVRLRNRTGIAHIQAHTFRRTFALWSLRSGMSIYHLQRLMGHEDITVLRRYVALADTDLEDAHRKHGPVDSML